MSELLSIVLSVAFLAQVARTTVPFALAALGGAVCERSGVVNIALEGKLILGALGAAIGAWASGSVAVGMLAGAATGALVAAVYGAMVVRFRADQIVVGVAVNLLAIGLSRYVLSLVFDSASSSAATPGFGATDVWAWLAGVVLLVLVVHGLISYTRFGLRVRAVGEHPEAADSLGVSVVSVRWKAILVGGTLAGLGGGWMAMLNESFVAGMSNGSGYMALAAVIMGRWRPVAAVAACLFFGFAKSLDVSLQATALGVPSELAALLPYALTLVLLPWLLRGRGAGSSAPSALGRPW